VSRVATTRLKVNAPLGSPPTLEWRAIGELLIDPTYQRSIDTGPSQSLIRKIAMYWDWGLCQPLAVSRRPDGSLTVVDGQHRASAAKLRGDIPHLPCVITAYSCAGDEAAAFVALNQMRRPLSALDLFKAAVTAEDTEALLILDCMASAGLSLAPHSNHTAWKPGQIANIGGLRTVLRSKGERVLRDALAILSNAFKGEILRYAGTIFPGIAHIVSNEHQGLTAEEIGAQEAEFMPGMIDLVGAATQAEWSRDIIKKAGELNCARRDAAGKVFGEAWCEFLDAYFDEDDIEAAA
jgi:hypothetical protein